MEKSFEEHFGSIKDPRTGNAKRHLLSDIIGITVIAIICRSEAWEETEEFAKAKEKFLRKVLVLKIGIPSHDTLERVFKRLSPKQLESCFRSWMAGLFLDLGTGRISWDGKVVGPRMVTLRKRWCIW